ncbi:MAG: alpha/beta hydrolase [Luteolibacter sp.]
MPLFRIIPPLLLTMLLASCASQPVSSGPPQKAVMKSDFTVRRDIVYTLANWPAPVMGDLYRPVGAKSAPAVLLVHGGGWTGKDGRWQMTGIAKKLAKRGYVVLNVTYRLAPRWIYPAPVDDLKQAVKWMRTHAAEEGIDPQRISTYGYSAGGYLAALVGLDETQHIKAIIAGGTPADLTLYPGGDLVPQFLGGTKREIPDRFREASPVYHVTRKSPPVFIYHGGADTLVPPEHAWEFIAALEKNKVAHEVYWIEGRDHIAAFLLPAGSVDAAVDFLDRKTGKSAPQSRHDQ